jgi:hypothetical protein
MQSKSGTFQQKRGDSKFLLQLPVTIQGLTAFRRPFDQDGLRILDCLAAHTFQQSSDVVLLDKGANNDQAFHKSFYCFSLRSSC